MSKAARRLGRGLSSLVTDYRADQPIKAQEAPPPSSPSVETERRPTSGPSSTEPAVRAEMIPPESLSPNPFQPRGIINNESIIQLADSIRHSGFVQPITARLKNGRYEIIAGERRWRAARHLKVSTVPVLVRDATDQQMLELALIENIQREDLNAMDRARAYRDFCDRFDLKPERLANRLGEDRTTVVNYLRLLELPQGIQVMVADRRLSMGHARCLLGVTNDDHRRKLAEMVCENELSVRALEEIVRREKRRSAEVDPGAPTPPQTGRSPHLQDLIRRFEERVKSKVVIHEGARRGSGRIVLHYYSLDDFDRIASLLGVATD